jgi:drug/metabolite transporter (DMT)-like permease
VTTADSRADNTVDDAATVRVAELGLVLVVLLWGANFTFIKLGIAQIPAFTFAGIRFTLAGIVLLSLVRLREGSIAWPRGSLGRVVVLGLLGNTIYQALFMLGLERTSVANASLIVAAAPVIVAVFGTVTGIERLTAPLIGGVVLATLGVTLVVAMRGPAFGTETLVGDLAVLIATFSWAAYTLLLRKYRLGVSDLRLTALTMLTGAPGLALLGLPGFLHTDWRSVRLSAWIGVAGSTFLAIVVAYILWNRAVRQLGSARASIFSSGVPLTAMLVAWPVLGEHPRPLQIAGAVLIVGGVLLSRRKR